MAPPRSRPQARQPFLDENGLVTREWYRFFTELEDTRQRDQGFVGDRPVTVVLDAVERALVAIADDLQIAAGKVGEQAIINASVTAGKLAASAVTDVAIAQEAVKEAQIAVKAVTANKIADNAVEEQKVADAAVTALKLADFAVTNLKIADGAVDFLSKVSGAEKPANNADVAAARGMLVPNSWVGIGSDPGGSPGEVTLQGIDAAGERSLTTPARIVFNGAVIAFVNDGTQATTNVLNPFAVGNGVMWVAYDKARRGTVFPAVTGADEGNWAFVWRDKTGQWKALNGGTTANWAPDADTIIVGIGCVSGSEQIDEVQLFAEAFLPDSAPKLINESGRLSFQDGLLAGDMVVNTAAEDVEADSKREGLFTNGGFETGTLRGWSTPFGSEFTSVVAAPGQLPGNFSARLTVDNQADRRLEQKVSATEGDRLELRALALRDSSSVPDQNIQWTIDWLNVSGGLIERVIASNITNSGASGVQSIRGVSTAPANTVEARCQIGVNGGTAGTGAWLVDACQVTVFPRDADDVPIPSSPILDGLGDAANRSLTGLTTAGIVAANAVVANSIAAGAVGATAIAAGAVLTDKLEAGAVTTPKLAAGAVTADEIAADAITASKIQAEAVGTTALAALAITADKIATNTIIADRFLTDEGVDLAAIVPGALSWKRSSLDSAVFTPPLEPSWSATKAITAAGPIATQVVDLKRVRWDAKGGVDANLNAAEYRARVVRRTDGGAWTEVLTTLAIPTGANFDTFFLRQRVDLPEDFSPPAGPTEYGLQFQRVDSGSTIDAEIDEMIIELIAQFGK